MRGKGWVIALTIVLGLICIGALLPTYYVYSTEKKAEALSGGNEANYQKELDILSKDTLNLGFTSLSYNSAKQKEIKLGLDLRGGINVLLQINERDLISDLTNYSTNPILVEALNRTDKIEKTSTKNYLDLFFEQFAEVNAEKHSNLKLSSPAVFGNQKMSSLIKFNTPDSQVKTIIRKQIDESESAAFQVISTRIDKLHVTQPNVQRVPGTGRIMVEMPGVKDKDRVIKLLQTSARLQFWEVQSAAEVAPYFQELASAVPTKSDSLGGINKTTNLVSLLDMAKGQGQNGVAFVRVSDTATVNKLLKSPLAIQMRPANLRLTKFMWEAKPDVNTPGFLTLYGIRGTNNGRAPLDGAVKTASVDYDQIGRIQISMQMDQQGTKIWKDLTEKNIGKPIAVTLDNMVYTAPTVNTAIPNGQSVITGNFSQQEAKDLVDVLNSGKLPATAKIVQADVVGPSLGAESIHAGLLSFVIAFVVVLFYMIFYYGGAGVYAVIAMILNVFFIFGILISIGATLTLPGIGGIVLTMGMAVDANVIIYERTKEELAAGKGIKEAYTDGFKHAWPAIIDGNLTTLLTAIILYIFGSGPIQGFAITLIIGILMTLFTAVAVARVMIFERLEKGKHISLWTPITKNWFRNVWVDFIGRRKYAYIFSVTLMVIGLVSVFTNGFKLGVDFEGGRSYVVRFDQPVKASEAEHILDPIFKTKSGRNETVDAKTFGSSKQLRITTNYKVDDVNSNVDTEIEHKLYQGLKKFLPAGTSEATFSDSNQSSIGIVSSTKVGPTVAENIKVNGTLAVVGALIGIFIYILVRFKRWQFSLGGVASLFHDATIIIGVFSVFWKIAPFNMEINQDFIAAILTVLGYSINDTVIVFDRIREYLRERKAPSLARLFDDAISSTLGRTINTSMTTFLVVVAIFIFGGDSLKGFMFALMIGVGFGTYSSIFVASAIAYDSLKSSASDMAAIEKKPKAPKLKPQLAK